MKDSDNIDELYQWVNGRYEEYTNDEITEEQYLQDLEYYKQKLVELETADKPVEVKEQPEKQSISPATVRSTSIAGLRKKLMEEMKK